MKKKIRDGKKKIGDGKSEMADMTIVVRVYRDGRYDDSRKGLQMADVADMRWQI